MPDPAGVTAASSILALQSPRLRAAAPPSRCFPLERPLLSDAERSVLDRAPWFRALPMVTRHDLLRHGTVRRYGRDAAIQPVEAGQAVLHAVLGGAIRIGLRSAGSAPCELLPPGTWFADPLNGGRPGDPLFAVHAHGATTVLAIPLPEQDAALHAAVARLAMDRMGAQLQVLDELSSLPLRRRLARCLLRLLADFGEPSAEGLHLRVALTQGTLAQMIRVSRARLNLELRRLEHAGVLRLGLELVVRDAAALASLQA